MSKVKIFFFFLLLTNVIHAQEQKPAFWEDIQAFKKQDSVSFPPRGAILFIGSSSFTMWKDVQDYFPSYVIVNRGFGGSTLPDVTRYADDIIFPYYPKQIVIYCGENDLASSDTISSQIVLQRFMALFTKIRKELPHVPIVYISIKPSPGRQHLMPKMRKGNILIKRFLKKKRKTSIIDVYHKMLNADGTVMNDIFLNDKLHMNAKGYAIWQKSIEPYLLK